MTESTEERLSRALHQLADVPGPPPLADAALGQARRRRRLQAAGTGAAALVALAVIATPFALRGGPEPAPFAAGAGPTAEPTKPAAPANAAGDDGDCVPAPSVEGRKEVREADWPPFVAAAVEALPVPDDTVVQYAYDFCHATTGGPLQAYAVVNLGPNREQGHLTVNLHNAEPPGSDLPATCAEAETARSRQVAQDGLATGEILSCVDGTATTPFVLVTRYGALTATVVAPDGRTAWIESIPDGPGNDPGITQAQLTAAATELLTLVPAA